MRRAIAGGFLVAACGGGEAPTPPPPEVEVMAVTTRDVPIMAEFTGSTRGWEDVVILARVAGFLQEQSYAEGELVEAGALLFVIDPRPFEAALAQTRAGLAEAEARKNRATIQVNRLRPLAEQNAVSQQDLDNAVASEAAAQAEVEAAQAQVTQAELDLSYTRVTSPIRGLAGIRDVDVGTFVGSPQPTVLTIVSDVTQVRVDFSIPEAGYLQLAREILEGRRERASGEAGAGLELVLADGSVYPEKGRVTVVGRGIDPETGTLPLQAVFPNPDMVLRPGQFVRVRVPVRTAVGAIVVPQRTVLEVQGTYNVAVVGPDSTIEIRPVVPASRLGPEWVIAEGLAPGERIVLEGLQRVRHGARVRPTLSAPGMAPAADTTTR